MDFFTRQDNSRRQSQVLLLVFALSMAAMGALIHVVVGTLSIWLGYSESLRDLPVPIMVLIGIVWLTVLMGAFFRALDVRAGGAVLARRFGAVHASDRSRHQQEKELMNIVAETAIAAGCPQPDVFVMRNESSINAFVVGATHGKYAIVVTQAALDSLDRDQLQAVIAHECGHITNGDVAINMRLLIVLGGLLALDEVGRMLCTELPVDRARHGAGLHFAMIPGLALRFIGVVGVFFGSLVRAAFTRQREYLADASAVQFTRNPFALAHALTTIRDHNELEVLHTHHASEIAHLCFHLGTPMAWYRKLFHSHPPIQKRIDSIEPHFDVKMRTRKKHEAKARKRRRSHDSGGSESMGNVRMGTSDNVLSFGPPVDGVEDVNTSELPDRTLLLLPDSSSCLAVLFAVFASKDEHRLNEYLGSIAFAYTRNFADQVLELIRCMPQELHSDQLSIIDHATAHLRENLKTDNRLRFLKNLERLVEIEGEYTLMNYATLQLIRRRLDVEFPVLEQTPGSNTQNAEQRRVKTFDAMEQEFALLLSLIVESTGASQQDIDAEFQRVLKCYTQNPQPRRTGTEPGIIHELEAAFQTLYVQPQPIRQAFVQHCVEIIERDGRIERAEQALLDLFAASLGCELSAA